MEFGKFSPEKFKAILYRYGDGYPFCTLPVKIENECRVCIEIPERVAKCGAGRFFIKIMDGCTECDTIELELVAECVVNSVTVEQSLPLSECCTDVCR